MSGERSPVAQTSSGPVRGRAGEGGAAGAGILNFRGIPYAAAPVGPLRFQPPEPPTAWAEPRDATEFGPTAPQRTSGVGAAAILPNVIIPGEESLTLNVWTPGLDGARPVMVFIHGGAFATGSGAVSIYDGTTFARDGVVLVTINYRLGADGFLWFGDGVPNLGILDQVAALEWVRDNIAAFGGDPNDVTIFGESAGAMSVCTLLVMPRAQGLFHRAIAESGAGDSVISPESARLVGTRLAAILGVAPTREGIGSAPQDALLKAGLQLSLEISKRPRRALWGDVAHNLMAYEPIVDGDILPGIPRELIAAGASSDVQLLIGTNSDEGRLFFVPTGAMQKMSGIVPWVFASIYGYGHPWRTVRSVRRRFPDATAGERAVQILTEGFYRIPALQLADTHPGTFVYEFAWDSGAFDGALGACHALELPFVFDSIRDPSVAELLGQNAPQELANRMHAAWVAFATTGDPGWPAYTAEHRASMRFDTASQLSEDRLTAPGFR